MKFMWNWFCLLPLFFYLNNVQFSIRAIEANRTMNEFENISGILYMDVFLVKCFTTENNWAYLATQKFNIQRFSFQLYLLHYLLNKVLEKRHLSFRCLHGLNSFNPKYMLKLIPFVYSHLSGWFCFSKAMNEKEGKNEQ